MSNIRKLWYLRKVMKQQWLKTFELEEIQRKMLRGMGFIVKGVEI